MITLAPITRRGPIAEHHTSDPVHGHRSAGAERRDRATRAPDCSRGVGSGLADHGLVRFPRRLGAISHTCGDRVFCLLFGMLYDLLTQLLRVRRTDFDMLSAGVAAYFLLGVAWAASFDVIERLWPGSFRGLAAPQWSDYLYFSMGQLRSVTARSPRRTRSWASGRRSRLPAACSTSPCRSPLWSTGCGPRRPTARATVRTRGAVELAALPARVGLMSVRAKSSPLNSSGSPVAWPGRRQAVAD